MEIGASRGSTCEQLASRIESVEGRDLYQLARELKRGAVLVTAHFGNFEVGMAAICRIEPRVHVVFQRDGMTTFERLRHEMHRRLGVMESPIDEGAATWMSLRDALAADGVVLLQGDRAVKGQKSSEVVFFDGHIRVPHGPVKLAMLMNTPLIPVYVVQTGSGRVRIVIDDPIHVNEDAQIDGLLTRLARSLERMVARHPDQWHVLHYAWIEDGG